MSADPSPTIVLDVETARTADEVGGWGNIARMGVAVAVTYDLGTDQYRVFDGSELPALRDAVRAAGRLVTWNGWRFDIPVIFETGRPRSEDQEWAGVQYARSCDLYDLARRAVGNWACPGWKLGDVAERTVGHGKSGEGALAPELFKAGKVGELVTYCLRDVWLTAKLYRFAREHGYLIGPDGKAVRVSV